MQHLKEPAAMTAWLLHGERRHFSAAGSLSIDDVNTQELHASAVIVRS
jgi:hypothetical protein